MYSYKPIAKYSIWLDIPKHQKSEYQQIIDILAKKYKGPLFEPHVTLVGEISGHEKKIISKIKKMAEKEKPFKISLDGISFSTTYFQSVFLKVSASQKLMNLNLRIKHILEISNDLYMPHMSLLYGNQKMSTRENIAKKLNIKTKNILIRKILIVPSTNNPADWHHVSEIYLGSNYAFPKCRHRLEKNKLERDRAIIVSQIDLGSGRNS